MKTIDQKAICHLFLSPLRGESRLFKELATAETLFPAEALLAIGLDKDGGELSGELQGRYPYQRIHLRSAKLPKKLPFHLIKYIEWTFRAAWRARKSGAVIIHCHSFQTLPAAVLAGLFSSSKVLYDAHELESRRANFSRNMTILVELLEQVFLCFVDEILAVSPSIHDYYSKKFYKKNVSLLMNVPQKATGQMVSLRKEFSIPTDAILVMYVGGLVRGRGIDLLMEAFSSLSSKFQLVFMGDGYLRGEIEAFSRGRANVHLKSAVEEKDVVPTVSQANLTFSVNDCHSLNHQYSLPNKFFQSLMAGVPVLVNEKNVDMLLIGRDSGLVFSVDYHSEAIRNFIETFSARHILAKPQDFSWENQENVLIAAYRRLLGATDVQKEVRKRHG